MMSGPEVTHVQQQADANLDGRHFRVGRLCRQATPSYSVAAARFRTPHPTLTDRVCTKETRWRAHCNRYASADA